jgi:hypothetical protein
MKQVFPEPPECTFDIDEVSAGVYRVIGTHLNGYIVHVEGTDPEELLEECRNSARNLLSNQQLPSYGVWLRAHAPLWCTPPNESKLPPAPFPDNLIILQTNRLTSKRDFSESRSKATGADDVRNHRSLTVAGHAGRRAE